MARLIRAKLESTMKVKDMPSLYVESLKDLYSAEQQLLEALPKMVEVASAKELKTAFKQHLKETSVHSERLVSILEDLDEAPGGHKCKAMEGLVKEAEELIRDVEEPKVRDAGIIGAAQKVEHYEISGYGTARTFALLLGHTEHADMLQLTLDEEHGADEKLWDIAESMVNAAAAEQSGTTNGKPKSATSTTPTAATKSKVGSEQPLGSTKGKAK